MTEARVFSLPSIDSAVALVGIQEENFKTLHQLTGAKLVLRGQDLYIDGTEEAIDRTMTIIQALQSIWQAGRKVGRVDIRAASESIDNGHQVNL